MPRYEQITVDRVEEARLLNMLLENIDCITEKLSLLDDQQQAEYETRKDLANRTILLTEQAKAITTRKYRE